MTEDEKWAAMRKTALSDHEPFCNYGQTNGREMCTCQVLVDFVEGTDDDNHVEEARALAAGDAGRAARVAASHQSSSDARKARLARQRAGKAKRA